MGPTLVESGKRGGQQLGKYCIEQRSERWQRHQFIDHGLVVQAPVIANGGTLVFEYVAIDRLVGHLYMGGCRERLAPVQGHAGEQFVIFSCFVQLLYQVFGQRRAAVVLLNTGVGAVGNHAAVFRRGAQHETAGQGHRFLVGNAEQNSFGEHRWRLLTA
ncbi:hypothetical protein D3C85_803630 [compost metagenome]